MINRNLSYYAVRLINTRESTRRRRRRKNTILKRI